MNIGILKEQEPERRVALLPELIKDFIDKHQVDILIEKDAGKGSYISDEMFEEAGAKIVERSDIFSNADVIGALSGPDEQELSELKEGQVLLSTFQPLSHQSYVEQLLENKVTSFSLDNIPRTSRAQSMDVLSSQATLAGYKAVIEAANYLPVFFPMFMTAAGTIKPAKVMVLGAGVAGLQAIATARRLGAVVSAFDVRSAVKEEVVSLGAKFIEVEGAKDDESAGGYAVVQSEEFQKRQMQVVQEHAVKSDVIIATAQIPGKKAPLLITKETVNNMKQGSVIVDLAASSGGNCEVTQNDKIIHENDITIIGESNFPATIPVSASYMFGKNFLNFLRLLISAEHQLMINFDDDIIAGTCVTHQGELISERIKNVYQEELVK
ncbi:MAG: Re/Si-specific NAD(P)(+) transhydrogenase subunit alpha [Bacteroidales bacterium]